MKEFFILWYRYNFFLWNLSDKGFWHVSEEAKGKGMSIGAKLPSICLMLSVITRHFNVSSSKFFHNFVCVNLP